MKGSGAIYNLLLGPLPTKRVDGLLCLNAHAESLFFILRTNTM